MEYEMTKAHSRKWLAELYNAPPSDLPVLRKTLSNIANEVERDQIGAQQIVEDGAVDQAREEILARVADRRPQIPLGLDTSWKWEGVFAGMASGSLAGAKIGAGFGIATAGWGMAATIPTTIIGGLLGAFLGEHIGRRIDKPAREFIPNLNRIGSDERVPELSKPKDPSTK